MRTATFTTRHLAAATLMIAAAGSCFVANAAENAADANPAKTQQATRTLSKSQVTRQRILQKVAEHQPLTYNETLYLR
jgi:hypothetical protein